MNIELIGCVDFQEYLNNLTLTRRSFLKYSAYGTLGLLAPSYLMADGGSAYGEVPSGISVGSVYLKKKKYKLSEKLNGRVEIINNSNSSAKASVNFKLLHTGSINDLKDLDALEELIRQAENNFGLKPNSVGLYKFEAEGSDREGRHNLYASNEQSEASFEDIMMSA